MIDSDKQKFREVMIGVGELYGKEVTMSLLRVYFSCLEAVSFEDVKKALSSHTLDPSHGSFMPKPADIVRQIEKLSASVGDRAEIAWLHVTNKIRTKGAYGKLSLDDKQAIAAVKAMGTWQSLCHTPSEALQWKKKEFMELYKTFERTPLESLPSHLGGIIELRGQKASSTMKKLSEIRLDSFSGSN